MYAWRADEAALRGGPVHVTLPDSHHPPNGYVTVNDEKLTDRRRSPTSTAMATPRWSCEAIHGQYLGAGLQPLAVCICTRDDADGSPCPVGPVEAQALIGYYGSAQEPITEGVAAPTAPTSTVTETTRSRPPEIFSATSLFDGNGSS